MLYIFCYSVAQGIHDFKANRQTEAMQSFNKALQIDTTNVEALVARGAL
jgi:Flp pilus assembly protein TadD